MADDRWYFPEIVDTCGPEPSREQRQAGLTDKEMADVPSIQPEVLAALSEVELAARLGLPPPDHASDTSAACDATIAEAIRKIRAIKDART